MSIVTNRKSVNSDGWAANQQWQPHNCTSSRSSQASYSYFKQTTIIELAQKFKPVFRSVAQIIDHIYILRILDYSCIVSRRVALPTNLPKFPPGIGTQVHTDYQNQILIKKKIITLAIFHRPNHAEVLILLKIFLTKKNERRKVKVSLPVRKLINE